MIRSTMGCLCAMVLVFLGVGVAEAATQQRPNILFVLMDDLGWSDVGCYLSHHAPHVGNQSLAATLAKYQASLPADCPVKASYAAMVEDADTSIGRLLQVLDELELSSNTMVVLYSDNGPFLNNTTAAPLRMGKGTFYEGGIRQKNHKLIHFYEDDRDELYDLDADPGETNDLSKTQRALAQSLRASLDKWLTEVNAPLPTRRNDAAKKEKSAKTVTAESSLSETSSVAIASTQWRPNFATALYIDSRPDHDGPL